MGAQRTDPGVSDFENDYQVIRLSLSWGALSVLAFTVVLTLQLFGRTMGVSLPKVIFGTLGLAAGGFLCGLIGLRFGRGRGVARVGAFLNGVVLLIIFIVLPIAFRILSGL